MPNALVSVTRSPEFNIVIYSFLLHFVWEYLQAPTYAGMIEMSHWDGIKLCTGATFGAKNPDDGHVHQLLLQ